MKLFMVIAMLLGMLVPVQTAANARMRMSTGSACVVTLVSFAVSSLLLSAVSAMRGMPIWPTVGQVAGVPWWGWTGGIIALFTITATIYLFRALGQLQTAILTLSGQLLFSVVIDHFGLFGSISIPFSVIRAVAILMLIAGVVLVVVPGSKGKAYTLTGKYILLWQLAGIATGCLMASIGTIYGALGVGLGSAVQASTLSFFIATAAMLLFCTGSRKLWRVRQVFSKGHPWWMWLGGVCGAISVFGNAWLIPQIGAGAFFMALLLGQMSFSLLMEGYGWLGAMRKRIGLVQFVGIALMVAGVAIIKTA